MSGEAIVKRGTQKTLEASGASIVNNALAQADDATYSLSSDGGDYPDARFVLACTFGTAPTENTTINLYARPLDVDGTLDTDVPETTRPTLYIGRFKVNNVTSQQVLVLYAKELPDLAEYYIHNNGTGQTISSGWTLKVSPRSVGPAA